MNNDLKIVKCGCGGQPEINYIHPYWHLSNEWQVQIKCKDCNIQTDWCKNEDKKYAEAEASIIWNTAMNKERYCYNCNSLEDQRYCLLYGLQVELGMSCDNWEYKK